MGKQSSGRSTWGIWGLGVPASRGSMTRAMKRPCCSLISPLLFETEKMAPQSGSSSPAALPQEDEEATRRMMAKRVKIIAELMQTERDYISDLDLCIKEVIQPLRNKQVSTGGGGWGGVTSRSKFTHGLFADHLKASTNVSLKSGTVPGAAPELAF